MKGLVRSMSRGPAILQTVVKTSLPIKGTVEITGVDSAVDAGTLVLAGLPQGNLLLLGAVAYVSVTAGEDTAVIDNWGGDFGIGYAANVDSDLADAQEDAVVASTSLTAGAEDKTTPVTRGASTATEHGLIIDNTEGSLALYLNLLVDDNVITDTETGSFEVSGFLHLAFIVLGDD